MCMVYVAYEYAFYGNVYVRACVCPEVNMRNLPQSLFHLIFERGSLNEPIPQLALCSFLSLPSKGRITAALPIPTQHLYGFWEAKLQVTCLCTWFKH